MRLEIVRVAVVVVVGWAVVGWGQSTGPVAGTVEERAGGIVKAMRFSDAEKTEVVTRWTGEYLRELGKVLEGRRVALERIGEGKGGTPEIDKQVAEAWKVSRREAVGLRDGFVAKLAGVMTAYQVERIKDGVTRDYLPRTLQVYDEMVPGLTHAERAHVMGLLVEMRENAMLEVEAEPQGKWVDKYRGIINNYIARQGYDFTGLAKAYDAKKGKK